MPDYQPSKRRIVWPNGAVATIYSGDEPGQLRGPQHDTAWVDELAKYMYPDDTWDNMEMGLRIGPDPKVIVTTTPRPIPIIRGLVKDPDTVVTRGRTKDNLINLSAKFIERIYNKYDGTRLGRQELSGEILEDRQGALWNQALIEKYRVRVAPKLIRIVVSIDPAVTCEEDSSETGIIVTGMGIDRHFYVMRDRSMRSTPNVWAAAAINLYHDYFADKIIGEVNNGGDLVESVIRNTDNTVNYRAVRASRGKLTRAEPISALYEQCVAEGTMIHAEFCKKPIKEIVIGERVWTRRGLKKVLWSGKTGVKETIEIKAGKNTLKCTRNHPIYTVNKNIFKSAGLVVPISDIILVGGNEICKSEKNTNVSIVKQGYQEKMLDVSLVQPRKDGKQGSQKGNMSSLIKKDTINKSMGTGEPVGRQGMSFCTEVFGNTITGKSTMVYIFIISMGIQAIIKLKTLFQLHQRSIFLNTLKNDLLRWGHRKFGRKILSRIKNGGKKEERRFTNVMNVRENLKQEQQGLDSARRLATQVTGIETVKKSSIENVYNLEVADCHEYFANNILVHNCKVHHVGCFPELEDQMCNYVPGEKSPDRMDACFTAGTMIKTVNGEMPISCISPGDYVITRYGPREVLNAGITNPNAKVITATFSNGATLTATPNHPIYTINRGFISLDTVVWGYDIIGTWEHITGQGKTQNIGKYGEGIMEKFLKDTIYTISTVIKKIIQSLTLNASLKKNTHKSIKRNTPSSEDHGQIKSDPLHQNGMDHPPELHGIRNSENCHGKTEKQNTKKNVSCAEANSNHILKSQGSVHDVVLISITKLNAHLATDQIDSGNPVYNLEVKDIPEYFANGILVHNCVWGLTELSQSNKTLDYVG